MGCPKGLNINNLLIYLKLYMKKIKQKYNDVTMLSIGYEVTVLKVTNKEANFIRKNFECHINKIG